MFKTIKHVCACIVLCCLAISLTCCTQEDAYITIMDVFQSEPEFGELSDEPANAFNTRLESWKEIHTNTMVDSAKWHRPGEVTSRAVLGADHLPDVFMTSAPVGRLLMQESLVLDLTDYTALDQDDVLISPYVYCDSLYAFPIKLYSYSLIIYDTQAFEKTNGGRFPSTWQELSDLEPSLKDMGYACALGFSAKDPNNVFNSICSPLIAQQGGNRWLEQMIAADHTASFVDALPTLALERTQAMLNSNVFCEDAASMDSRTVANKFVQGTFPAVLVSGIDVYTLLDQTKEENPDLYERLGFAALPLFGDDKPNRQWLPTCLQYGLFINANVANDPSKLSDCLSLCEYLSDAELRNNASSDAVITRLNTFLLDASTSCTMLTQYLHPAVWSINVLSEEDEQDTPQMVANHMQDAYEEYYLGVEDYSSLMKEATK